MYMLANVAASAASQRFGAPDDASAGRGRSYAQTRSPGWTSAFRELLRSMPDAVPHQQWIPARSGGQLRRGGCTDAGAGEVGWSGGGASLHAALARQLHGMDKRPAAGSKENSKFRLQKVESLRSDPPIFSENGQISGDRELVNFSKEF